MFCCFQNIHISYFGYILLNILLGFSWFSFNAIIFIYLFLIIIFGCAGSPFLCGDPNPPPSRDEQGPLPIAASFAAEHRLQTRRLSNRGPGAQPLRGTQDPPRPGPEPAPPHRQADSQPLRHQGSPFNAIINGILKCYFPIVL